MFQQVAYPFDVIYFFLASKNASWTKCKSYVPRVCLALRPCFLTLGRPKMRLARVRYCDISRGVLGQRNYFLPLVCIKIGFGRGREAIFHGVAGTCELF
jgi:hypothetical protein